MTSLLIILLVIAVSAKFYPKQFDLSLIPEARNCDFTPRSEGICVGNNWAHVFSNALSLTNCVKTMASTQPLSSEHLLNCVPKFNDDRCSQTPQTIDFVTAIGDVLKSSGLATKQCIPDASFTTAHLTNLVCPITCSDGQAPVKVIGQVTPITTIDQARDHLGSYGPVVAAVQCTNKSNISLDKSSLNQYQSGDYTREVDDPENELHFGLRFVMIIGWTTNSSGEVVWKAQNTFGQQWANMGIVEIPSSHPYIAQMWVIRA